MQKLWLKYNKIRNVANIRGNLKKIVAKSKQS